MRKPVGAFNASSTSCRSLLPKFTRGVTLSRQVKRRSSGLLTCHRALNSHEPLFCFANPNVDRQVSVIISRALNVLSGRFVSREFQYEYKNQLLRISFTLPKFLSSSFFESSHWPSPVSLASMSLKPLQHSAIPPLVLNTLAPSFDSWASSFLISTCSNGPHCSPSKVREPCLLSPLTQQFGLVQMTQQFDEDGRAWYDDSNVAEFIWPSTSVASMAGVTALTMARMMAPTTTRMATAYHVQSDNCCHGLKDGRRHCRNGDCLPCPGWRLPFMFGMAALAVVEVTALPLSLLHAVCTPSPSMAGVTVLVGWPRLLAEAGVGRSSEDTFSRRNVSDCLARRP